MKNTTLCYIEKDGSYLMLHRTKKRADANAGKWIGVGGKFEPDESPDDCLLREVREETGLALTRYRPRGIVTFVSDEWETEIMHLFTADAFTGEAHACDEGDLAWVPIPQVESLPLWDGDRVFLRQLAADAPFFSLKLVYKGDELKEAVLNGRKLPLSER
ncbi:NUDIX domain-containing protein [Beduinella massiliensis]|uniref:NUDIX domain-containing protein n=1 Tax=Beduinella massiliensis TaxID=1852363 RepID=UPI000C85510D